MGVKPDRPTGGGKLGGVTISRWVARGYLIAEHIRLVAEHRTLLAEHQALRSKRDATERLHFRQKLREHLLLIRNHRLAWQLVYVEGISGLKPAHPCRAVDGSFAHHPRSGVTE